ncbi:fumarylpyruvate hydrolase [Pseudooceanicola antarcticus]|uniref:FAA hydrolase family protein n=1 Tax=Pseudooceanicola antarcticus TaxID=1247613 RepID=A0A285HL17_9RHOB|nr:fumarylacetoacetate hydrolase family protein [Pseudooceanicola antarcticus]PJE27863.1 FAA hydrolase family protein [Pseudooceanicola antarcticus]SNY36405.1 fumarylpyruvate hydrolase [Pseudooceanicola antarcticus]
MSLFDLPAVPDVPVAGETEGYPVRRIFCVGRNYAAHAAEMGNAVPEVPFYFTKSPAHMILTGETIPYPPGTENFHYEIELVVALGAPLFKARPEETMAAVYGYATGLDMTRRDLQAISKKGGLPWDIAKDVENTAVVGPMTRASDFGPLGTQSISLSVDCETRQSSTLDKMLNDVPALLSHLSGYYHLQPGDLIFTGTPEGVGAVTSGAVLRGEVEGLAPVELTLSEAE